MAADEADDLYGLPLDAFVPERDALAKRLRADGRRGAADEIKALRKPSVAAWAVNQVVRTQPKEARALWQAGDALIAAQEALLAGTGDAAALRTAVEDERAAVDGLLEAARGLLTGEGRDLGETTIERVRETLHAGAIDAEARADVAAGRAVRERAHAGLGPFGAAPEASPAARRSSAGGAARAPAKLPKARGRTPKDDDDAPAKGKAAKAEAKAKGAEGTTGKAAAKAKGKAGKAAAKAKEPTKAERAAEENAAAAREREAERKAAAEQDRERRAAARARADAEREMREARKALDKAQRAAGRANEKLAEAQAVADEANAALDEAQERDRAAVAELERTGGKAPK
jgi:hypothetical protein